jgi:hypothetical protein
VHVPDDAAYEQLYCPISRADKLKFSRNNREIGYSRLQESRYAAPFSILSSFVWRKAK